MTPERVRELLSDLGGLLQDAAAGKLGDDMIFRAAGVFRQLVGEQVMVHTERRPGRKRVNVYGIFTPGAMQVVQEQLAQPTHSETRPVAKIHVWLRKPPLRDALAPRVHEMIDVQGLSFRDAASALQQEGHNCNSGVVWQIYHRYYEMTGQAAPDRPYNNGKPRNRRKNGALVTYLPKKTPQEASPDTARLFSFPKPERTKEDKITNNSLTSSVPESDEEAVRKSRELLAERLAVLIVRAHRQSLRHDNDDVIEQNDRASHPGSA